MVFFEAYIRLLVGMLFGLSYGVAFWIAVSRKAVPIWAYPAAAIVYVYYLVTTGRVDPLDPDVNAFSTFDMIGVTVGVWLGLYAGRVIESFLFKKK